MLNLSNYSFEGIVDYGYSVAQTPPQEMTTLLWLLWIMIVVGIPTLYWIWLKLKKGEKTNDDKRGKS